jgi:hypothetical protein
LLQNVPAGRHGQTLKSAEVMRMESSLSKALTITALTCFLLLGAAAAAFLGRDDMPVAAAMVAPSSAVQATVSNRESKQDRLMVAVVAPAALEPAPTGLIPAEPLRQAFASATAPEAEAAKAVETAAQAKAKVAPKPPVQKSYTLLSDAQIAGIKERLKLSESQEYYWPAVENALRAVARKLHATRQTDPAAGTAIDPDSAEVQQLKSAAMPLLFQLREDQKREVRSLARLIGLEKVAAMI